MICAGMAEIYVSSDIKIITSLLKAIRPTMAGMIIDIVVLRTLEDTALASSLRFCPKSNAILGIVTTIAENNISFSNTDKLGGILETYGTTWTSAALVSQTSGLPLNIPIDSNLNNINIMNVDYPSLNESLYINYRLSNILQKDFSRWKLQYSSDENPYVINLSPAFSYSQGSTYKYGEFPSLYKSIYGLVYNQKIENEYGFDYGNNLILPFGQHNKDLYKELIGIDYNPAHYGDIDYIISVLSGEHDQKSNAYTYQNSTSTKTTKATLDSSSNKPKGKNRCPSCGATLVRRKGPYGAFWGCSNYPRCVSGKPHVWS
jgi:hypothetical protein